MEQVKASELRIGNIVKDTGYRITSYCIVEEVCRWIARLRSLSEGVPLALEYEKISPVPLTPELLQACGFGFVDMMFENAPMRYWRNDWLILHGDEVYIWNDKEAELTINIKFLHQLQNLYFALTGTELSINLEKVKV